MTVLVTGCAGFIGFHVTQALLARGEPVLGLDDLNPYYDVRLKQARLARLAHPAFTFRQQTLADPEATRALAAHTPAIDRIVHLAAQAGVRHSLTAPFAYAEANVTGHLAILELARALPHLRHLVYASSSSVYGGNAVPFRESDCVDTPLSLYAATKRAGELISHAYGHLFAIPQTGLRFFTVYGPWGRPDMAYFTFAEAIADGRPLTIYADGTLKRDFTYIDDIVAGILGCLDRPASPGTPLLLNIGNNQSETVNALIAALESALGRPALRAPAAKPAADVEETFADITAIAARTGFAPSTPLVAGIPRFVAWFRQWRAETGRPIS